MKKILVMVLCLIMAAMPVVAEELPVINIERVENLAAELGFEGATGEEHVLPAGEGYYVLWREDLLSMYVYCPDSGWNAVKADSIDESWAVTELIIYAENLKSYGNDIDVEDYYNENCQKYGSAAAAVLQICYGRGMSAYKGKDFILIKSQNYYVVIELNNYNVHIIDGMYIYDVFIGAEGQMLCYDSDLNLKYIDYDGNTVSYVDYRSKIDYSGISKIIQTDEGEVVVYSGNDGNVYAAWIDKQGVLTQNVYLSQGGTGRGIILYSESTDTVIYNKLFDRQSVIVAANKEGKTFAVVNVITGETDPNTYRKITKTVTTTAEGITYGDKAYIEAVDVCDDIRGVAAIPVSCLLDDGRYAYISDFTSDGGIIAYVLDLKEFELKELNKKSNDESMEFIAWGSLYERSLGSEIKHDNWHDGDDFIRFFMGESVYRVTEQ